MRIHDFNTYGNAAYIQDDSDHILITRGLPDGTITVYERAIYLPKGAGNVKVETTSALWRTAAPVVVVQAQAAQAEITVDGNQEDVYSLEAIALSEGGRSPRIESPPGIFMDRLGAVAMYTRENRYFIVDGEKMESGWYVHSLKVSPGTRNVFGISDVQWESGVRDGEVVHYHVNSIEPLVVLEGAAIMLVEVDGKYYSFKQEPGTLTVPSKGLVHGILQVEASANGRYRHMCAQAPSMFHNRDDRVVITGEGFPNGKTREYVEHYGIPPAL